MSRVITFLLLLFLVSCSTPVPSKQVTVNQAQLEKQSKKVDTILEGIEKNDDSQLKQTAILAAGTQRSLNHITNPPIEVRTAQQLNDRLISIVGTPNLNELQKINLIVDLLNSEVAEEHKRGEKLLADKDHVIFRLQSEKDALQIQYDKQMWNIADAAKQTAKAADENQALINNFSGFFGLNAVFWGLKRFFFSTLTFLIIFSIGFIILRILSMSNPIAAAAFSIFDLIGSIFVNAIKHLTPKAFDLANFTPTKIANEYKDTLTKIVDSIQELKVKQKDLPDKTYPLSEVLEKFKKDLDQPNKDLVEDILVEQKWKK